MGGRHSMSLLGALSLASCATVIAAPSAATPIRAEPLDPSRSYRRRGTTGSSSLRKILGTARRTGRV